MASRWSIWILVIAAWGVMLAWTLPDVIAQTSPTEVDSPLSEEETVPDHPGMDRFDLRVAEDARRTEKFELVRKSIERQRWDESAQHLQGLLDEPQESMVLGDDRVWRTANDATLDLMVRSPEAIDSYNRRYGAVAEKELAEAERRGDMAALTRLSRRFLLTTAGQKATRVVLDWSIDLGNLDFAVQQVERLRRINSPLLNDGPWRSHLALLFQRGGYEGLAKQLTTGLPESDSPSVWSLDHFASQAPPMTNWRSPTGQADGKGTAQLADSLLLPKWTRPLVTRLPLRELVRDIEDELDDQSVFGFSVLSVVGDGQILVARTLTGLVAFHLETGQILWRTQKHTASLLDHSQLGFDEEEHPEPQYYTDGTDGMLEFGIRQHLFIEGCSGTISANSQCVFSIENHDQSGPVFNEFLPSGYGDEEMVPGHLLARDLRTGQIHWRAGGPPAEELPGLPAAGVYFFGPPVADGDDLFVVGEREGDIVLFCLEADTGLVSWEHLVASAGRHIEQDSARRAWTAPVAVRGSLVICPTTTGWVTAVDRVTRSIVWSTRLIPPNPPGSDSESRGDFQSTNRITGVDERWPPTQPIILRDCVIIAPVEFPDELGQYYPGLYCFDLQSGSKRWETLKDRWVGVAGADDHGIYLFDQHSLMAVDPQTGQPLWTTPVTEGISGRPVLTTMGILVPTMGGGIQRLAPMTGQIVSPALRIAAQDPTSTESSSTVAKLTRSIQCGHLYSIGGRLVSTTPIDVTAFEWASSPPEWERAASTDPLAAVRWAHYLQQAGRGDEAARVLRSSLAIPDLSSAAKESLRQELFQVLAAEIRTELLRNMGAVNVATLSREARELASQPEELELILRLSIEWQIRTRDVESAWSQLRPLIRNPLKYTVESDQHIVQPDVWLAECLRQLAQAGTADQQVSIRQALRTEFELAWQDVGNDRAGQDRLLRVFAETPFAEHFELERALTDQSSMSIPHLEALRRSANREISIPASLRLIELLAVTDWVDEARLLFEELPPVSDWPMELRSRQPQIIQLLAGIETPTRQESWLEKTIEIVRQGGYDIPQYSEVNGVELPLLPMGDCREKLREFTFSYDDSFEKVWIRRLDGSLYGEFGLVGNEHSEIGWGAPVLYTFGRTIYLIHQREIHAYSLSTRRLLWHRPSSCRYDHDPNWYHSSRAGATNTPQGIAGDADLGNSSQRYQLFESAGARHLVVRSRHGFQVLCALTGTLLWENPDCPVESTRCLDGILVRLRQPVPVLYSLRTGRELTAPELLDLVSHLNPLDRTGLSTLREIPGDGLSWNIQGWRLKHDPIDMAIPASSDGWDTGDALTLETAWSWKISSDCRLGEGLPGFGLAIEPEGPVSLIRWSDGEREPVGTSHILSEPTAAGGDRPPQVRAMVDRSQVYLMTNGSGEDSLLECPSVPVEGVLSSLPRHGQGSAWEYRGSGVLLHSAMPRMPYLPVIRTQPLDVAGYSNQRIELTLIDKATGKTVIQLNTPSWGSGVSSASYDSTRKRWELTLNGERLRVQQRPSPTP